MKLKFTIEMDAERDREGETAEDEKRLVDLAHEHMTHCMAAVLNAAKAEGLSVELHSS